VLAPLRDPSFFKRVFIDQGRSRGRVRSISRRMRCMKRSRGVSGGVLYDRVGELRVQVTPIPNTEVKPTSPDGTARASVWEE
jgi:hypothetical protein